MDPRYGSILRKVRLDKILLSPRNNLDNRVLRWDVERRQIGAALDVRKVMPSSETIKTLDVDAVTGDTVVSAICLQERATDSQIYIATTRGLLIVANAQQVLQLLKLEKK